MKNEDDGVFAEKEFGPVVFIIFRTKLRPEKGKEITRWNWSFKCSATRQGTTAG
jgi:hypothetical protein